MEALFSVKGPLLLLSVAALQDERAFGRELAQGLEGACRIQAEEALAAQGHAQEAGEILGSVLNAAAGADQAEEGGLGAGQRLPVLA